MLLQLLDLGFSRAPDIAIAWGPIIAAAIGAIGSFASSKKSGGGSGHTDYTTTQLPWGPATGHRIYGMNYGRDLLGYGSNMPPSWLYSGQGMSPWGQQDPRQPQTPWPTDVEGRGGTPLGGGYPFPSKPQWPEGFPPGGGGQKQGQGATVPPAGYQGQAGWEQIDPRFNMLLNAQDQRVMGGHPLYGASTDFAMNAMGGQTNNPYLDPTYGALGQLGDDPNLARYRELLFGMAEGDGGGGGVGVYPGGGGGGGISAQYNHEDPVGSANYIKEILEGRFLNEDNPNRQAMLDALTRDMKSQFAEQQIPGINAQFSGMGRFGSQPWQNALSDATGEFSTRLGDTVAQVSYGEYENRMNDLMEALGLGTQRDVSSEQAATSRHNQLVGSQAQLAASRASAGASAGAAAAGNASRERIAQLEMLGNAIGMGLDARQFGLAGQSGLAELMSGDQNFALSMVPELSGMGMRDFQMGMSPYMGLEGLYSTERIAGQDRASAERMAELNRQAAIQQSRIGARAGNRAIDFDVWRYGNEQPWNNAMRYADLINAFSGPYGTTWEHGYRPQGMQQGSDPFGSALAGGLSGWALAGGFGTGGGGG